MSRSPSRANATGLLEHERDAASGLRAKVEEAPALTVTLRELRDAFGLRKGLFGRAKPTPRERVVIEYALACEGVALSRPLAQAALDDRIELSVARPQYDEDIEPDLLARLGRRTWSATVALSVIGGAVLFAAAVVPVTINQFRGDPPLARMTGKLKVAVAQPQTPSRAALQEAAREMGASLFEKVQGRLRASTPVLGSQVWGPDKVGTATGEDVPALASRIGAQIVLYGRLSDTPVSTVLAPSVYLDKSVLAGVEELAGSYGFGSELRARGPASNPVTQGQLEDQLAARAKALGHFLLGLSAFETHDYATAQRNFRRAAANPAWSAKRPELLSLMLGNAALKLGDYDRAIAHFDAALTTNDTFRRAQFARTEARFVRDHGLCQKGRINRAVVEETLGDYLDVIRAIGQASGSGNAILRAKARFGAGRAHFCLTRARIRDDAKAAEVQYRRVIAAQSAGTQGIDEQAAEAYAGLAALAMQSVDKTADPRTAYERAVESYRRAIEISGGTDALPERYSRQGVYESNLASVFRNFGDDTEARRHLARAIELEQDPAWRRAYVRERNAIRR